MPAIARKAKGNTMPATMKPPPTTIGHAIMHATRIAIVRRWTAIPLRGGSGSPSPGSTGTRMSAAM